MAWRNVDARRQEIVKFLKPGSILTVFDTETTGVTKDAKIIQFSGIKYVITKDFHMKEIDNMVDVYINPEEKLQPKITEITGITDSMLEYAETEKSLGPLLGQWLEESDVLAAYNCQFDLRMMQQMGDRLRLMFDFPPCIDVLQMSRDLFCNEGLENYKLCTVVNYLFPDDNTVFHSAINDVQATARIMDEMIQLYLEAKPEEKKEKFIYISAKPWINTYNPVQQRIIINPVYVTKGGKSRYDYFLFYDVMKKVWQPKSGKMANGTPCKDLFDKTDIADVEKRLLYQYKSYGNTVDEICSALLKEYRSTDSFKKRQKEAKTKKRGA